MKPSSLTVPQQIVVFVVLVLLVASVFLHNHPSMDTVETALRQKAPTLFKMFILGEAMYFGGMILMALGLGTGLGLNPLAWTSRFRELTSAETPGMAKAKVFWLGFVANALGSTTFAASGLYVAIKILPGGSWTLIPASLVDLSFALFVRLALYRRFAL